MSFFIGQTYCRIQRKEPSVFNVPVKRTIGLVGQNINNWWISEKVEKVVCTILVTLCKSEINNNNIPKKIIMFYKLILNLFQYKKGMFS